MYPETHIIWSIILWNQETWPFVIYIFPIRSTVLAYKQSNNLVFDTLIGVGEWINKWTNNEGENIHCHLALHKRPQSLFPATLLWKSNYFRAFAAGSLACKFLRRKKAKQLLQNCPQPSVLSVSLLFSWPAMSQGPFCLLVSSTHSVNCPVGLNLTLSGPVSPSWFC